MFCTKMFDSKILIQNPKFGDPVADKDTQLRSETPIKSMRWLLSTKMFQETVQIILYKFSICTGSGPEITSLIIFRPSHFDHEVFKKHDSYCQLTNIKKFAQ